MSSIDELIQHMEGMRDQNIREVEEEEYQISRIEQNAAGLPPDSDQAKEIKAEVKSRRTLNNIVLDINDSLNESVRVLRELQ